MELGIEPLDPELVRHLRQHPVLGEVLVHPMVYSVPYHTMLAKWVNAMLAQKKAAEAEAIAKQDWARLVFLYERPWRITAFSQHEDQMQDAQYWALLGQLYTDSENVAENFELWGALLCAPRPERAHLMSAAEQAVFAELGDEIDVFRGDIQATPTDYSWTLSQNVAHWFAQRTARLAGRKRALVIRARIRKQHVIAYKNNRNEEEIIALPQHVQVRAKTHLAVS